MIYHKDIGFPAHYRRPLGIFPITHTRHVRDQSVARGITIPSHVNFNNCEIIEVGFEGMRIDHILVRMVHDSKNDVCIPLAVKRGSMIAKTAWLCDKWDKHKTLDRSKYATP